MKAIVIAAGMGSRLQHLTKDLPKCLLKINGKSILEHQFQAFKLNGIQNFSVIKGYQANKINYSNIKYYINGDYQNNNILHSLFYARDELNDDVLISYSDIVYGPDVIEKVIKAKGDFVAVVDTNWKNYYVGRTDHPVEEAEGVVLNENKIIEIGKHLTAEQSEGEFIGLLKISKKGCEIFKKYFDLAKEQFEGKPFIQSKIFKKAYLTDILQFLINNGIDVNVAEIDQGWMEIDTVQDYERAEKFLKELDVKLN